MTLYCIKTGGLGCGNRLGQGKVSPEKAKIGGKLRQTSHSTSNFVTSA
jgi:hypothetical protein